MVQNRIFPGLNDHQIFVWWERKPNEIYRQMYDSYQEACFCQTNINRLNIDLLLWARVEKTIHGMETHWLLSKEKLLGTVVCKEGYADSLSGHERTCYYWFLWKGCNCK